MDPRNNFFPDLNNIAPVGKCFVYVWQYIRLKQENTNHVYGFIILAQSFNSNLFDLF